MNPASDVVHSVACDYVTASATELKGMSPFHALGSALFRHEREKGNQPRSWGLADYKGWSCGHVQVGVSDQRCLIRASSDVAALNWKRIVELSDNVTRFDVQATIITQSSVTRRIDKHKAQALRFSKRHNEKPVVRWIADNRGGYTLYLGARESNVFGRVYDKWAREQVEHFRNCVRFEVQFQYQLAKTVARGCAAQASPISRFCAHVSQFLESRGVEPPALDNDEARYSCSRTRSDSDKKLLWLATAVRPSVMSLIDEGRGQEVLQALGLIVDDETSTDQLVHNQTKEGE